MTHPTILPPCDTAQLRSHLLAALAEADRCDELVAIHVATALAVFDERRGSQDQSSAR